MTEDLNQNYNITKPHNIKLKGITLGWFLLLSVLCPVKNIAMHNNRATPFIIMGIASFGAIAVDIIPTSLYNYFTKHNNRKPGEYRNKYFLYIGRKFNITENFYIDLYFSTFKFLNGSYYLIKKDYKTFLLSLITVSFNIRIYKNFYISFTIASCIALIMLILSIAIPLILHTLVK